MWVWLTYIYTFILGVNGKSEVTTNKPSEMNVMHPMMHHKQMINHIYLSVQLLQYQHTVNTQPHIHTHIYIR